MPNLSQDTVSDIKHTVLANMHKLMLEALRLREQEIIRYLAILGPAFAGFVWLLDYDDRVNIASSTFIVVTSGVILLLFLGAIYSLALGYNYRYITLQLAKLECKLGTKDFILVHWPRTPKEFLERYRTSYGLPWCTPPGIIKIFWLSFVLGIAGVSLTAYLFKPEPLVLCIVIPLGAWCFVAASLSPIHSGGKLQKMVIAEMKDQISNS